MFRRRPRKIPGIGTGPNPLTSESAVALNVNTPANQYTTGNEDPVVTSIKKWREELGLHIDPLQSEPEELDLSKPIIGIKDLRQLSRMHSTTPTGIKHNDFRFIYCIRRDQRSTCARYNPYDLKEVGAKEAQEEAVYYTVSAHCVTQISKDGSVEVTTVPRWLWERQLFSKVVSIPFFSKVKMWRIFIRWRNWILKMKWTSSRIALSKKLFCANEVLQGSILKLRQLIEQNSNGSISLLTIEPGVTYNLEEFVKSQILQIGSSHHKLRSFREDVVNIVEETCTHVALSEGFCNPQLEPSHTQILQWRSTLAWLRRFVLLCDYMVLDFLQKLVMNAIESFHSTLCKSFRKSKSFMQNQTSGFEIMNEAINNHRYAKTILERMDANDDAVLEGFPLQDIIIASLEPQVTEQYCVPHVSNYLDYEEVTSKDTTDPLADLLGKKLETDAAVFNVRYVLKKNQSVGCSGGTSLCSVSVVPSFEDFEAALNELLNQYTNIISSFGSLMKDDRILPLICTPKYDFMTLLEEEESASLQECKTSWVPVQALLCDYTPYCVCTTEIKSILRITSEQCSKQTFSYIPYCKMVENCLRSNIASSLNQKEWTTSMFQLAFAFCHDQICAMKKIMVTFRVWFIQVNVQDLLEDCLHHPQMILARLEIQLPKLAGVKSESIIQKMKMDSDKLTTVPATIERFVEYLGTVEKVSVEIAKNESEINLISKLYNVAHEFNVHISDEDLALYKILFPQLRHLKSALVQAEATKSEGIHRFSSELKSEMVNLLHQGIELKQVIESPAFIDGKQDPNVRCEELYQYQLKLKTVTTKAKQYFDYCQLLVSITTSKKYYAIDSVSHSWTPEEVCKELTSIEQSLEVRKTLFEVVREWSILEKEWSESPLKTLKIETLQAKASTFVQTIDYLERSLPPTALLNEVKDRILSFCSWLPTVFCLLNPKLKIRHWEILQSCIGGQVGRDSNVTIQGLKELKAFENHSVIADVSNSANHESVLENMLNKISQEWMTKEFIMVPYSCISGRQTYILGGVEDLLISLDDALTTLATIRSSKYVNPIKHAIQDWDNRLSMMMEVVETWMVCQKNWICLEEIFASMDLQRQLSNEARQFQRADKAWRDLIHTAVDKMSALKFSSIPGVLESFELCNGLLEQVFRSLEDYLESKRQIFPRFYFISDNELLDIMSHTRKPFAVQPYISKLFGNVRSLEFFESSTTTLQALAMVSTEGERLKLIKPLPARGSSEQWLSSLETLSLDSVKFEVKQAVDAYDPLCRTQWLLKHISQAILTAVEIIWTNIAEKCLQGSTALSDVLKSWIDYVTELAQFTKEMNTPLINHYAVISLLTLDVHRRDILQSLVINQVTSPNDFHWLRQLRSYWQSEHGTCVLKHCVATFPYGNEYLGCPPRLVVTPLSERCYLTLTSALYLHLGGSPVGPSGTGKSETVKDLARAMGKLCIVINCSEELDHKIMSRFHSGMCQSGVWCCFDEFNRINVEVLSAIAQQLVTIKAAKDSLCSRFIFESKEIKLVSSCAAFVTMNPGYAGRFELPDNLKMLFRPIAMVVPDTAIITEVLLLGNGFTTASVLAPKLTKLYQLAAVQLLQQTHYDFGLRALKAVIALAGEYLRNDRCNQERSLQQVELDALLLSLQNCNQPRLITEDIQVMKALLQDMFNIKQDIQSQHTRVLEHYLEEAARSEHLQICKFQLEKCLQLYSTMLVRHGAMVLGPTGGGKSTALQLMAKALNAAHEHYYKKFSNGAADLSTSKQTPEQIATGNMPKVSAAKLHCQVKKINPKCLTIGELYGFQDLRTLEWIEGILSRTIRTFSSQKQKHPILEDVQKSNEPDSISTVVVDEGLPYALCAPFGWRWIILDGPIDPGWVENLNSTLDDSKLLSLSNGERIELGVGTRILFETDDLSQASPATVSRCGVVYMDTNDLGWEPFVHSWLDTLPHRMDDEFKKHLLMLFNATIDEGLQFLKQHVAELSCAKPSLGAVHMLCSVLKSLIDHLEEEGVLQKLSTKAAEASSVFVSDDTAKDLYKPALAGIYIPNQRVHKNAEMLMLSKKNANANQLSNSPLKNLLNKLFVFAFTWSFGGNFELNQDGDYSEVLSGNEAIVRGGTTAAAKFDAFVHKIFNSNITGVQLPNSSDLIYSYCVDVSNCAFVQWEKLYQSSIKRHKSVFSHELSLPSFLIEADPKLLCADEVGFMPTVDSLRLMFFMTLLLNSGCGVLLSGRQGVGKTKTMNRFIELITSGYSSEIISKLLNIKVQLKSTPACEREEFVVEAAKLHVSSRTQPFHIHSLLEKSSKKGKPLISGNAILLCLDDMHMSMADNYGSFPCLELLRQLVEEKGWYEKKSLSWKTIRGVSILGITGFRHSASKNDRLLGKFCTFCYSEPSVQTLSHIYSAFVANYLTSNKFQSDIVQMVPQLVSALIYVYKRTRTTLLPTPQSPQFLFTTHDLSKAFSGFIRIHPRDFPSKDCMIHLMSHEAFRVFSDRCLPSERNTFSEILSDSLRIYFQKSVSADNIKNEVILYEEFSKSGKKYTPVSKLKSVKKYLEKLQYQWNSTENKDVHLKFFSLACEHVVRVVRVLQQPSGHLIMLGLAGVGKRSCIQMASRVAHCQYHQITVDNKQEYKEQLKAILFDCGIKEEPCIVLVVVKCEQEQYGLLHDLHELVVCGEVHGLFNIEEVENIVSQMTDSKAAVSKCWNSFTKRVQENLHVVLCCSPASQELEMLCSTYPGFIIRSTVNVYDDQPTKALFKVALKQISSCHLGQAPLAPKDTQVALATAAVRIHECVYTETRRLLNQPGYSFYVTLSSFIHFLKVLCEKVKTEKAKIIESCQHLEAGINQLSKADQRIMSMKTELEHLQPEVQLKAKNVEALLMQLSEEHQEMNRLKASVEQERGNFAKESQLVTNMAATVESDLQAVLPALLEAERGLSTLKKADFVEIRSYTTPPTMVMHVMNAICVLLQEPTDWLSVKLLMSDYGSFMKRLSSFDKDHVPDKVLSKLKKYTQEEGFTPASVAHYSVACKSFCEWALAVERYAVAYKMVEPKRKLCEDVKAKLYSIRSQLLSKEEELKTLEATLNQLQETYDEADRKREELQDKYNDILVKLERAQVLSASLGDEQVRWKETLQRLQQKNSSVFGDVTLLSAFLVYSGGFSQSQRQKLLVEWKAICSQEHLIVGTEFSVVGNLIDPELIHEWHVHSLPKDTHSIENGTIIMKCDKWPLIIDPEGQATRWLKNCLKDSGLITISYSSSQIQKTLEQAVQTGVPVLIENVPEHVKFFMDPFLEMKLSTHQSQLLLQVGKMEIEYNKSFRLFLICNNSAPQLGSELCNKTTVVNFTSTFEGLEDQLLAVIIRLIKPALESLHNNLLLTMCADRRLQNSLEDKILHMIQSISGNILDNEELIHALKAVKQAAMDANERIANALGSQKMVDMYRQNLQPIATRGSILYFSLLSLKGLSSVYQYSLNWFLKIFCHCIQDVSTKNGSLGEKTKEGITEACEALTLTVFRAVAVGLSSEHFTPFIFKLCCSIKMHGDCLLGIQPSISVPEWTAFVQDPEDLSLETVDHSSAPHMRAKGQLNAQKCSDASNLSDKPDVLTEKKWDVALQLEHFLDCFANLRKQLSNCVKSSSFGSHTFWEIFLKESYFRELSKFQQLILLRHLTPGYLLTYVKKFISIELGNECSSKPLINLKEILKSADNITPMMFILTPGTDPSTALNELVQQVLGNVDTVKSVSLGQGQEQKAEKTIQICSQSGMWAFLQNCHLAKSWLPQLEIICQSLYTSQVHPNFRLFLSTIPTSGIPPNIIQPCIKISLEPPTSTKSALKQLLSTSGVAVVGQETFENTRPYSDWKQLLFSLCYFHSVVKTKPTYPSTYWNLPHEFTDSDLQVSISLLQVLLPEISGMPWTATEYLVGNMVYGGRTTSPFELMHLSALLRRFCYHKMLPVNFIACLEPSASYRTLCSLIDQLPDDENLPVLENSSPVQALHMITPSTLFQEMFLQLEAQQSTKFQQYTRIHSSFSSEGCNQLVLEKCEMLLDRLPQPISVSMLSKSIAQNSSPYWNVLIQEASSWNRRLQAIVSSLNDTVLAVKGEIEMVKMQKDVYSALVSERVPKCWQFVSRYCKLSISLWISILCDEFGFIKKWVNMNTDPTIEPQLPNELWLPAITNPKGLLAAATQDYCRKHLCILEDVTLYLQPANKQDTVAISGVYLSGAHWNPEKGLVDTLCTEVYYKMPLIAWSFSKSDTLLDFSEQKHVYACPLYSDNTRKDLITTVHVPTPPNFTFDHWMIQGVAMFPHNEY